MTAQAADDARPDVLMLGPYPAWDMDALAACYTLHKAWDAASLDDLIQTVGPRIRAIATRGDLGASADLIGTLPNLQVIACYGVGTDAIDLPAARARGIAVTNTPDVLTGDVADLAVGLTLALLRRIPEGDAHVRSGAWASRPMDLVSRLHGKRVGIVGFGRIGQTVARRLSGFDVSLGYFARSAKPDGTAEFFADLTALAEWSDVLVVTIAGGASTQALVNGDVLAALGARGILVNVARGSVVDESPLLAALETGTIAGAALDVFWNEPHIDPRFSALTNVVLQPHHGSGTVETRKAMGELVRRNLAAHFAGQPLLTPVA